MNTSSVRRIMAAYNALSDRDKKSIQASLGIKTPSRLSSAADLARLDKAFAQYGLVGPQDGDVATSVGCRTTFRTLTAESARAHLAKTHG